MADSRRNGWPIWLGISGRLASEYAAQDGEPVDLYTGLFVHGKTDLELNDTLPIRLVRTYRQNDTRSRAFGIGAMHGFDLYMVGDRTGYSYMDLFQQDGSRIRYVRISSGTGYTDAVLEHTATPTEFYRSRLAWNSARAGWDITPKNATVYEFFVDLVPETVSLSAIRDRNGNRIGITRLPSNGAPRSYEPANIARITSPNGRSMEFSYDSGDRITQARDTLGGRTVNYTYDTSGRLTQVQDAFGRITLYTYDTSHRMTSLKDPKGIIYLTNQYDTSNGRVTRQTLADAGIYQFSYTFDVDGKVTRTDVIDPRSITRRVTYNAAGYPATEIRALGKPEQKTWTYTRDPTSSHVLSIVDQLNRKTTFGYDAQGNRTSITRLADTVNAVTRSFTYEPAFNQLASVTDPLNRTTTFSYDAKGNLTQVTDPLNHPVVRFTHNVAGLPVTVKDALNHLTQLVYDGGDLISITDPLSRSMTRQHDSAGRLVSVTGPLGQTTRYEYDTLDRPSRITDALGNVVDFTYDANGNLLTVTDARGGVTRYTYNAKDRRASRTDALAKVDSYVYDKNDNLTQVTDRKAQIHDFVYDALNRRTAAKFKKKGGSYESTITYTYDGGDRLTQAVHSGAGTVTRAYDGLDRMTQETTPKGTVGYGFDVAGRRTSMTAGTQAQVAYGYDTADRLTSITQGSSAVGFEYDDANRRMALTLPNGLRINYTYDDANALIALDYLNGAIPVGSLTYGYDGAGRRISQGGSFARVSLPAAVTSTIYDAGNRLTKWGSTTITYDASGNTTKIGTATLTWNARDQLSALSNASFVYDAFGRRQQKTIGGTTTGFLYDGVNPVQEQGASTVNLLTGLGIDEYFTRTDSSGTRTFLTDALGSTAALTDDAGAVKTSYTYDPYGNTSASGDASTSSVQYTGRENDGTGYYFYRARYYSPTHQRFLSEDPIGLAGGWNVYAYVDNNPVSFTDRTGLLSEDWWYGLPTGQQTYYAGSTHAVGDFLRVYGEMRWANTKQSDRYFHCKANCEAAKRGAGGEDAARNLSELRECANQSSGDSKQDSHEDMRANATGLMGASQPNSCSQICSGFRPNGLGAGY